MRMQNVRFGLIGFGAWGNCHAGAIDKTQGVELVAIAARSEETCAKAREAYPYADVVTDYRELIARDDVDVVDVVLPSHLHHQVGSEALKGGKHLLMEKPMGLTIEECDDLIRLAKENGQGGQGAKADAGHAIFEHVPACANHGGYPYHDDQQRQHVVVVVE